MTDLSYKIVGRRAYFILYTREYAALSYRPVNQKTGKPWQAPRKVETFYGEDASAKALAAWNAIAADKN